MSGHLDHRRWWVWVALLCGVVGGVMTTTAQTVDSPAAALGPYADLPVKICGKHGVSRSGAEIPWIGCFGLASGGSATGNFDSHQFAVSVSANGVESCLLDGNSVSCDGCIVKGRADCPATLTVLSRNADRSVYFDVARRFKAKSYVTNQENWEYEQARGRDGGGKPAPVPRQQLR